MKMTSTSSGLETSKHVLALSLLLKHTHETGVLDGGLAFSGLADGLTLLTGDGCHRSGGRLHGWGRLLHFSLPQQKISLVLLIGLMDVDVGWTCNVHSKTIRSFRPLVLGFVHWWFKSLQLASIIAYLGTIVDCQLDWLNG